MSPAFFAFAVLGALILGWILGRRSSPPAPPAEPQPPLLEGWQKLDQLLSMLLQLQEHGVSHAGAVSREAFCTAVLDSACQLMNCSRGTVMAWDENAGYLKIMAAKGPAAEKAQTLFLKPGDGIAGKVFVSGQPIFVSKPSEDPRYVRAQGDADEPFVCIPLLVKAKPIGVLNLHAEGRLEPIEDYHIKFLSILAGEAAVMLHNLDLFDNLETFYLEMVKTLARAVDSKDAYTHDHSDRASLKARKLAGLLGLPDQMSRYVEYAALLHDIGKIGIDEAILLKPGKLTPEEYEQMKKHPIIGHQILAPVKFLGPVAQMVLYHQEWFDGRGYPEGLKGEEIPLGARMVAVIDAWDAMTSDRPYRKALGRDKAVAELRRGAGTQFDPKVVEAFLKLEDEEAAKEQTKPAPAAGGDGKQPEAARS